MKNKEQARNMTEATSSEPPPPQPPPSRARTAIVRLDALDEAPENANVMPPEMYARLVSAMRRLGTDLQPVLVRPNPASPGRYWIVDGHHRARAAREAGADAVSCVVASLDDEEASLLGLGMNRLRGELDLGLASAVIASLVDAGATPELLALSGFSDEELAALVRAREPDEPDPVGDVMDPEPAPAPTGAFVLEVEFSRRDDFARAKRALRRAAGKGGSLAQGLMRLVEGEVR